MLGLVRKACFGFSVIILTSGTFASDLLRDQKIAAVIEDQIAAFKAEDGERAFSHASPKIKSIFKSAARFNAMVKRTYGMIYSPEYHQLEELKEVDGIFVQSAIFVSEGQQTVRAIYEMQLQDDGTWKINSVFVQRVDDKVT